MTPSPVPLSNATVGNHKLMIQAALKLNQQELHLHEPIAVTVAAYGQAKSK